MFTAHATFGLVPQLQPQPQFLQPQVPQPFHPEQLIQLAQLIQAAQTIAQAQELVAIQAQPQAYQRATMGFTAQL